MNLEDLVNQWFENWESGEFSEIPVEDDFIHESPFGIINGKMKYLATVKTNKESFLGHRFEIHEKIFRDNIGCVRYTSHKGDWSMKVSEWFYKGEEKIRKIVSYYNVGNVSYEQNLNKPDD